MVDTPRSPLAPARFPTLPPVAGVRLGSMVAGIRYRGRTDLMMAAFDRGTTVAGVLTKNRMPGAPVDWCRRQLPHGRARALVVKSGNANVFTGRAGVAAVEATSTATADLIGCKKGEVLIASTGVIGEPLPHERVTRVLPKLHGKLTEKAWRKAAEAIRTTDTFAKGATRTAEIDGKTVTINGIAKGSGMIAPDMATMLAFFFTDAKLPAAVLRDLLKPANEKSFNSITVDGDTSTSDTVLLFATGKGPRHGKVDAANDPRLKAFRAALLDCMTDLAQQIVRDGEGAGKFISITVTGAASAPAARRIGLTVANSPLVKTAIAGADANWGRIVMAVGRAGERADRDRLSIEIGGIPITEEGGLSDGYDEADVVPHMLGDEIDIHIDVGVGRGRATVWTCDLTHGYIDINADYRS
ncbi:MAG: bifunctional glutamate N-acetyltransferase/amino-acid acetyltransferase ArgJ [Minwuiales bacterium]|nr:bifunctional glutamate N-acetyltransferase/amino-acid acetyltransferase ArgJ [Minwuiales bacterium]